MKRILSSKIVLFILLAILCLIIVIKLDFLDSEFSYHDILVEFHGLVFDLFIFGIILTIYESLRSKKEKLELEENKRLVLIDRYKEEINDIRFWKSKEAFYRIRGLVKRLVDLKEEKIDLSHCYLETDKSLSTYRNMKEWKFYAANLRDSFFLMSDMTKTQFYMTKLSESSFVEVNLMESNFENADLYKAQFKRCNLNDVKLNGALVGNINWFEILKRNKNIGIDSLENEYIIDDEPIKYKSDYAFRIRLRE